MKKGSVERANAVSHGRSSDDGANREECDPDGAGPRNVPVPPDVLREVAGEDAEVIIRSAGRPPLDPNRQGVGRSPGRQVRLPHHLNNHLKEVAAAENRSVSEVIREAVNEYLGMRKEQKGDDDSLAR